jgi:hypothetical protein
VRPKQFDERIEESPDFMTLRDHIAKTVTGDGKKVMIMGALWRLVRLAAQVAAKDPTKVETKPLPSTEAIPLEGKRVHRLIKSSDSTDPSE